VNTKNISLAYLLANYLKFNAQSFFFPLQNICCKKELLGCKKIMDKSFMKERRNRKIYEPKFVMKISSSKIEEPFQIEEH